MQYYHLNLGRRSELSLIVLALRMKNVTIYLLTFLLSPEHGLLWLPASLL